MNYEFKGTPGPWTLGDENNHCCDVMIGDTPCTLQRNSYFQDKYIIERDEMLNNAHLIMSAPDLLQVAINAINDLRNLVPQSEARDNRIEQIEVVIHKALNIQQ